METFTFIQCALLYYTYLATELSTNVIKMHKPEIECADDDGNMSFSYAIKCIRQKHTESSISFKFTLWVTALSFQQERTETETERENVKNIQNAKQRELKLKQ